MVSTILRPSAAAGDMLELGALISLEGVGGAVEQLILLSLQGGMVISVIGLGTGAGGEDGLHCLASFPSLRIQMDVYIWVTCHIFYQ